MLCSLVGAVPLDLHVREEGHQGMDPHRYHCGYVQLYERCALLRRQLEAVGIPVRAGEISAPLTCVVSEGVESCRQLHEFRLDRRIMRGVIPGVVAEPSE